MKYSVLIALMAPATGRHHHHHQYPSYIQQEIRNGTDDFSGYIHAKNGTDDFSGYIHAKNGTDDFSGYIHAKNGTDDFSGYAQTSTPDESRAAWQTTRDTSRAVAAEQERFQLEHNTMVAKNYADDVAATNKKKWHDAASRINMMNGGTTPFKTVTNAKLDSVYAQTSDPLGHSDASFIPAKAEATNVVETQKAFEAKKTADVAARNAANTNEANALKEKVRAARNQQQAGDQSHNPYPAVPGYYKNLYIPEEELYLAIETPAQSYKEKAESLAVVKQTVATQLKTMDDWQAQHAAAMKQWKDDAAFTHMVNHQEIKNLYEFD